jgi:hypothetical protein
VTVSITRPGAAAREIEVVPLRGDEIPAAWYV